MAKRATRNPNERLAAVILKAQGIRLEDWLNDQYQQLIAENTDLLVKAMNAQNSYSTGDTQEERQNG